MRVENFIERAGIVAILRGIDREAIIPLADALYSGGIRALEIPFDATGKISDTETAEKISMLTEHFGDRMVIGSGTVLTEAQVILTHKAGGSFALSPDVNAEVIKKAKSLGLLSVPGAMTPSEITAAYRAGADFVKLFPASSLGAEYIKDICAPLSHIKLMAVGGINKENASAYIRAGACAVGVGSALTDNKLIADKNFKAIAEIASEYVQAVRGA